MVGGCHPSFAARGGRSSHAMRPHMTSIAAGMLLYRKLSGVFVPELDRDTTFGGDPNGTSRFGTQAFATGIYCPTTLGVFLQFSAFLQFYLFSFFIHNPTASFVCRTGQGVSGLIASGLDWTGLVVGLLGPGYIV
ncbi:hypothetical protein Acr_23g0000840 [Actinidia rufa]|uniref:Uncharacterized protein n=1 Tax=Actinidia rufa TaxID=165716 RepID=A0A7J0GLJ6_9ERIC|nr:hypothetical protein Acr_23g0000840 [Actinidia rufa]